MICPPSFRELRRTFLAFFGENSSARPISASSSSLSPSTRITVRWPATSLLLVVHEVVGSVVVHLGDLVVEIARGVEEDALDDQRGRRRITAPVHRAPVAVENCPNLQSERKGGGRCLRP